MKKIKMRPDDGIPAHEIDSPETLNRVREAVRGMGYRTDPRWGSLESKCGKFLFLDDFGDLSWHCHCHRIIHVRDLLGELDYMDGEWHDWTCGNRPVPDSVFVEVELSSGSIATGYAQAFAWSIPSPKPGSIARFRVRTENTKQEKEMQLSYSVNNVMAAAKFCYENNTIYADPQDAYERIMEMMKRYARDPDATFAGTGGFMILFDEGNEGLVHAEVLVSPDLAEDHMEAVYNTETL